MSIQILKFHLFFGSTMHVYVHVHVSVYVDVPVSMSVSVSMSMSVSRSVSMSMSLSMFKCMSLHMVMPEGWVLQLVAWHSQVCSITHVKVDRRVIQIDIDIDTYIDINIDIDIDVYICIEVYIHCLLYTSPSPRDGLLSRMPSSA